VTYRGGIRESRPISPGKSPLFPPTPPKAHAYFSRLVESHNWGSPAFACDSAWPSCICSLPRMISSTNSWEGIERPYGPDNLYRTARRVSMNSLSLVSAGLSAFFITDRRFFSLGRDWLLFGGRRLNRLYLRFPIISQRCQESLTGVLARFLVHYDHFLANIGYTPASRKSWKTGRAMAPDHIQCNQTFFSGFNG